MKVENRIGESFDTLGQRILYSYIATYPTYKPIDEIPEESHRQMYEFMAKVLNMVYENPKLIGIEEQPDNCYKGWELNNSKPELIKAMEKIEAKFVSFIESLIKVGKCGKPEERSFIIPKAEMTVSKQLQEKLQAFGIAVTKEKEQTILTCNEYPDLFPAWKIYSMNDDENSQKVSRVIAFIHGRYFEQVYHAVDFFGELLPDTKRLEELEGFFAKAGFALSNFDISNKTRYAYVKWLKEYPDKETASMRVSFNWRKEEQLIFEFRVPWFRTLLSHYTEFTEEMQSFIFHRLKTCDGCGYCTQMDKSGKRPRLAMKFTNGTETLAKCPLFPWFVWTKLQEEDLKNLLQLFVLAEQMQLS